jgi:hypothetical protein
MPAATPASAGEVRPMIWADTGQDYMSPDLCNQAGQSGQAQGRWRAYRCEKRLGIYMWELYADYI